MRPKQIRTIDRDGSTIPTGRIIVTDAAGAKWSRGALISPIVAGGRLSPVSNESFVDNVGGGGATTTLYYVPHDGSIISLYDLERGWIYADFGPFLSLDVSVFTPANGRIYDVFVADDGIGPKLELEIWNGFSDTNGSRNIPLVRLDGVYVKSTNFTRRYVGTVAIRLIGDILYTEASKQIWNVHNQVPMTLFSRSTNTTSFPSTGTTNLFVQRWVQGLPTRVRSEGIVGGFNSSPNPAGNGNILKVEVLIDFNSAFTIGTSDQTLGAVPDVGGAGANFSGLKCCSVAIGMVDSGPHTSTLLGRSTIADGLINVTWTTNDPARGLITTLLG